ncbi:MAG TPA: ABC transporter permease, partial [Vicinamibacteria bacterium]
DFLQDLRYGWRSLRRTPAFTLVAIGSLALGIGANTAIFTLVDALILRALPVREPVRLVRLEGGSWTNPIWEQVRARQDAFGLRMAAFSDTRFNLAEGGEAVFAEGLFVSGGFFDVLGVPAILGRTLSFEDDRRDGSAMGPTAVISHAFWQRRFGGAADAVNRALTLNGVSYTIVGVTPPGFFGPTVGRSFDVAVPVGMVDRARNTSESWLDHRSAWWLEILGRLGPGQTTDGATQALRAAQPAIREATLPPKWEPRHLEEYLRTKQLTLVPAATGFSDIRSDYERPLLTVMAVVVLVLLIACANVASLLLARANARRQELGARLALGAGQGRLARQLLTESLLLAVPGALLGLVLAQCGSRLLVAQISTLRSVVALDVSLHWRVLLFTIGVTLAVTLVFGVAPALRARRLSPRDAMQQQGRSLAGAGPRAIGRPLVVAQVALSLVLVFAAGLFLRTFSRLASRDLGFDQSGILLVNLDAQRSASGPEQFVPHFAAAWQAAAAVPGVDHAALSMIAPVSRMGWNETFHVDGGPQLGDRERVSWVNGVTPGWFGTYRTRLLAGRDFEERDRRGAPYVAIVNQAFVRRFVGEGRDAMGKTVIREGMPDRRPPPLEVIGVVQDAVYQSVRDVMEPTIYLPLAQLAPEDAWYQASLAVRSSSVPPASLVRGVAGAIQAADARMSLTFQPLEAQLDTALMRERILALLSAFFGGLAVLLAGIGLYGVTAYAVSRRRTEIGVRMALGADSRGVVRLVLHGVAGLLALGIGLGTAISLWSARFVSSLLYELEPSDPLTLAAAAAVLVAVGLLAAALPARTASRIDPAEVLREG